MCDTSTISELCDQCEGHRISEAGGRGRRMRAWTSAEFYWENAAYVTVNSFFNAQSMNKYDKESILNLELAVSYEIQGFK